MTLVEIRQQLSRLAEPAHVIKMQRFFKTGKGEYGEGDQFIGVRVPKLRQLAKTSRDLTRARTLTLLKSRTHEERLLAVLILVLQYQKGDAERQLAIYQDYLGHTQYVNNWDIVDSSAYHIVGPFLEEKNKKPLFELAQSDLLWDRRIAIVSTYHYIHQNQFDTTLALAEMLVQDGEDLMHKAVGWMVREVGNRDFQTEYDFLKIHYQNMPRTMLRYAIEKFEPKVRKAFLSGEI